MLPKSSLIFVSTALLIFTSCGGASTPEEKLSLVLSESICLAQEARDMVLRAVSSTDLEFSDLEKRADEMKQKAERILKDNFKSEQELRAVYESIPEKERFEEELKALTVKKCNADESVFKRMMTTLVGAESTGDPAGNTQNTNEADTGSTIPDDLTPPPAAQTNTTE